MGNLVPSKLSDIFTFNIISIDLNENDSHKVFLILQKKYIY